MTRDCNLRSVAGQRHSPSLIAWSRFTPTPCDKCRGGPVPTLWVGWWTNLKRWTQGILPRPSRPFEDKRHGA